MKKVVFMLAFSIVLFQLSAKSQARVGVAGGVSIAKMEGKITGDSRTGAMFNLLLDTDLGRNFSFFPTLGYVQKGVTEPSTQGDLIDKQYVALRYFELTTNLAYHIGDPGGSSFFIGAGPSIAVNLPSKRTSITDGLKSNTDILFGETAENDIKGFDYGVNVMMGWKAANGFLITGNWNKGIRDLSPIGTTVKSTNQYIGIQLGIFLNRGKTTDK
jgi:hypothetical protein